MLNIMYEFNKNGAKLLRTSIYSYCVSIFSPQRFIIVLTVMVPYILVIGPSAYFFQTKKKL